MSAATMNPPLKQVPKQALHVPAGRAIVQFAAGGSPNELAITMFARSPEAIDHWYWGRLAHDMTGMRLRKDRIPLDWCHDYETAVGFAERFEASEQRGLTVWGKLVSIGNDKAADVIARLQAGIPMEASIDFEGPMRLEEVGQGMTALCNGRTIEGPATIVREWRLNAVAVCPFGADPATRTQFSASRPGGMVSIPIESTDARIAELQRKGYSRLTAKAIAALKMPASVRPDEPTAEDRAATAAKFAELKRKGYSDNMAKYIAGIKMPASFKRS